MRTVRDVMKARPLFVDPRATVQTSVLLLRNHQLLVLPVVDRDRVIGVVDAATLYMYQPDVLVADVMSEPAWVSPGENLSSAAALMRRRSLPELPVVDAGLVGTLRAADLLNAWSMPVDALTGMDWQDCFRLRSAMHLAAGRELSVLFFDMDGFGALNKQYGHVVGDRALKAVAGAIKDALNTETDQACRFGGDEFVISTTRTRTEVLEWAASVRTRIMGRRVDGLDKRLSVSVGIAGGLRQGERPGAHPPATLDDLINLASRASTTAKTNPAGIVVVEPETEPNAVPEAPARPAARPSRLRIHSVQTQREGGRLRAEVHLEHGGAVFAGRHEDVSMEEPAVVAEATASAVSQFLPARYMVQPTHVKEQTAGQEGRVVMAMVRLEGPDGPRLLVGVANSAEDPRRAAAKAVLDALNRPLETLDTLPVPAEA